jgi:hypothetical protein
MKRDDFNVRIDEVRELATKYSKPDLQRMVQMGLVEPQKAVMAGMMIDRIAKSVMQPPQTTVAQDVLGMAPTAAQGQIPPEMAQGQPPQMPPQAPPQMAAGGGIMDALPYSDGVAALPTNLPDYAGGGIVAFADGGSPEDYVRASRGIDSALAGMQPQSDMPVLPGGYRLRETSLPERSNIATEINAVGEAERAAGYDPDMYKRMREEELGRKDELAKRKEDAKNEAILAAGIGLMGARKGQEFETFSKVSQQALSQYKGDVADIRKSENEMRKAARELEMAENAAKKSKSEKGLERYQKKQDAYDAAVARRDETYNAGMFKLVDYFSHQEGIDKQTATQMAISVLNNETQLKTTGMNIAAQKAIHGTSETERMLSRIEALRKAGKEDEAKALEATYRSLKTGDVRSGLVTDKELQDAYEERRKGIIGKKALEEFDRLYPTWREYALAQGKSGQPSSQPTGRTTPSGAASGQIDTSNPLLVR